MLSHGVTTVEAKSGYGLSTDEELRLLRLAGALARRATRDRAHVPRRTRDRTRVPRPRTMPRPRTWPTSSTSSCRASPSRASPRLRRLLRARRFRRRTCRASAADAGPRNLASARGSCRPAQRHRRRRARCGGRRAVRRSPGRRLGRRHLGAGCGRGQRPQPRLPQRFCRSAPSTSTNRITHQRAPSSNEAFRSPWARTSTPDLRQLRTRSLRSHLPSTGSDSRPRRPSPR